MVSFARFSRAVTQSTQSMHARYRANGEMVGTETVCILGADGAIGRRTIEIAINCGYQVQALAHKQLDYSHPQLRVRKGSPLNARDLRTVITGSSCVMNLLNLDVGRVTSSVSLPPHYSTEVTKMAMSAMHRQQISRYLLVSHPSVVMPADRRQTPQGITLKYLWPLVNRRRWRDLQTEADLLSRTQLAWTLIRCPKLKDVDGYGPVDVDRHCPNGTMVSLDRLARFLVYQKDCDSYLGDSVFVASRLRRSRCF